MAASFVLDRWKVITRTVTTPWVGKLGSASITRRYLTFEAASFIEIELEQLVLDIEQIGLDIYDLWNALEGPAKAA